VGIGLGPWEIVLILVVLLLVFGARRLPELGGALGKGIREFKGSLRSIESDLDSTDAPPPRQQVHAPREQPVTPPAETEASRTATPQAPPAREPESRPSQGAPSQGMPPAPERSPAQGSAPESRPVQGSGPPPGERTD
jgi:sec-independent protein translocase protein TatA